MDRRKVLKPIFNAARKTKNLKEKTFLSKDCLIIDGKTYTTENVPEANAVVNMPGTCQWSDTKKTLLFGIHSVFSNLHPARLQVENVSYNCTKQTIQSQKAAFFNDDISHAKIMQESNPYKMKKISTRIHNFDTVKWKKVAQKVAYMAVKAKFEKKPTLCKVLLSTRTVKIAKSSTDDFWGTGLHLYDRNAMNRQFWANRGGLMSDIYDCVHQELRE